MSENKKADKITAVKGMNDVLPADAPLWELFENTAQSVLVVRGWGVTLDASPMPRVA